MIDGFRAIAALGVVLFHYTVRWTLPLDPHDHLPQAISLSGPFDYGWTGVELFFVISGFVILMTLDRSRSPMDFAIRRVARLWPMLIVATILAAAIVDTIGPRDWRVSWTDDILTMLTIHPPGHRLVDGVVWTLGVEIRFYAIVCALHALVRSGVIKAMLLVQSIAFVAFVVHRFDALSWTLCDGYLPYFLFGMCCYALWAARGESRAAAVGLAVTAILILVSPFVRFPSGVAGGPLGFDVANVAILALFGLFVVGSPIVRPFASPPLRRLGEASYALYLIHQTAGISVLIATTRAGVPLWIAMPVVLSAVIGLSLVFFRFIELPAKTWLVSAWSRPKVAGRSAVSLV